MFVMMLMKQMIMCLMTKMMIIMLKMMMISFNDKEQSEISFRDGILYFILRAVQLFEPFIKCDTVICLYHKRMLKKNTVLRFHN